MRDLVSNRFHLHLITDRKRARGDLIESVRKALEGGVDWVQVREKTAPAAELYEQARQILEIARPLGVGVLINDRVDVALALGASGVHLAKKSLPPQAVRPLLRPGQLLGRSVHSLEEALAFAPVVDYLTFGNVFPTESHPGIPPKGVEELERVVNAVDIPVLAIGGITLENLDLVLQTGCSGIAVIGAILAEADPSEAARRLREALDRSAFRPRIPFLKAEEVKDS
ncbi:MAG: thiamine phosphate synthase [Armatimonadota bacterium]|nr:thiamine phosphate synthase [Armatimonadota bacterium]MDR5702762.1 thiamine phosphate synthase [Armatimonadota bacterium]